MNDKVNQLYHRVSMIQLMADNHQKTIQELEARLKENEAKTEDPALAAPGTQEAASAPEQKADSQPIYPPQPGHGRRRRQPYTGRCNPPL